MSHLVLQFRPTAVFLAATDHYEQRSQRLAAQTQAQALPVPFLLADGQQEGPAKQQAGCQAANRADSILGYEAALAACGPVEFADTWDRSELCSLLLSSVGLQRVQAGLLPTPIGADGGHTAVRQEVDIMQALLRGDGATGVDLRPDDGILLEPVVLPPPLQRHQVH